VSTRSCVDQVASALTPAGTFGPTTRRTAVENVGTPVSRAAWLVGPTHQEADVMERRGLREMSPALRTLVISLGAVDVGLRVWALWDLSRRPREEVAGPKALWAVGLTAVSSAGALPLAYAVLGRRRHPGAAGGH
jgi:hypothetical protein